MRITVVATGFDPSRAPRPRTPVRMATPLDEADVESDPEAREVVPRSAGVPTRIGAHPTADPARRADPADTTDVVEDLDVPSFMRRN